MESKDLRTEILPGTADSAKILRLASSLRMTDLGDFTFITHCSLNLLGFGLCLTPPYGFYRKLPDKLESVGKDDTERGREVTHTNQLRHALAVGPADRYRAQSGCVTITDIYRAKLSAATGRKKRQSRRTGVFVK